MYYDTVQRYKMQPDNEERTVLTRSALPTANRESKLGVWVRVWLQNGAGRQLDLHGITGSKGICR
jgi:hypothetical protein